MTNTLLTYYLLWTPCSSGLVVSVTRLPVAPEVPGSNLRCGQVYVFFHENNCDLQLWAWAAHLLQCQLNLPPYEGREITIDLMVFNTTIDHLNSCLSQFLLPLLVAHCSSFALQIGM